MSTLTLQEKFAATEASMNKHLVERHEFVRVLLLALVGKLDVFALGPPGVAKTMAATKLRDHISDLPEDAYFWRLLTKFTAPAELFGPPDLAAMDENVWRHAVEGHTLIPAKISLLDECFKGSSAILNSLLTYLNENVFHNDVPIHVDRWFTIGLSNELPDGEELNALFDRLDLRVMVGCIQSSSAFVRMLKMANEPVEPTLTVADIVQAHAEVPQVQISDDVYGGLLELRRNLKDQDGIEPSDRRFARTLRAIKAATWLRGETVAQIEDMRDVRHMLWSTRDEIVPVASRVLKLASPLDAAAMELREGVDELSKEFDIIFADSDNITDRNKKAIALHVKVTRASDELGDLFDQLTPGRRSEIMDELLDRLTYMDDTIMDKVFNLSGKNKKRLADRRPQEDADE